MPAGRSQEKRRFLHISYGKFREKAGENESGAEVRINKDNKSIWEFVFDYVEGQVTGIFHKEDDKFGNSFEVVIDDNVDKFQVSFKEGDSFFNDFFGKLPNVNLDKWMKIVPYDFEDKNTGKKKRGLVIWQEDAKIESKFTSYDKETKKFSYYEGFPEPEKKMDKEDWKIYFIKVVKFLRTYTNNKIIPILKKGQDDLVDNTVYEEIPETVVTSNDDLPF